VAREHRYLSEPLSGRLVGLVETDEDFWEVHYCQTLIGVLDGRSGQVRVRDPLDALATPD
jgi:hypothetical protein